MYKENNNRLNELIHYIENNLTEKIEYKNLAKILLVNEYTLHRIFYFITNITLSDYIRKRRLSMAALDLLERHHKVLDIAIKYQYESGTSFSRAFKKMMGFLPKDIHKNMDNIKYFPILTFEDVGEEQKELIFEKIENISFEFYTIHKHVKMNHISEMASKFWEDVYREKGDIFEGNAYGLVEYNVYNYNDNSDVTYHIASTKKFEGSTKYTINNKKFLIFEIDSIEGKAIGKFTHDIYVNFIPYSGYNLDNVPDIEEYIDNKRTKIYIAVK